MKIIFGILIALIFTGCSLSNQDILVIDIMLRTLLLFELYR